jgi:hypothetical protein
MEKRLFNWESWDDIDILDFQYHNCTLNIPIGPYAAGSRIDVIFLSYERGEMNFYKNGAKDPILKFKLQLEVTL